MSFFSKIASAAHTFGSYVEKEFVKLHGAAPKIEQIAGAILKYAGPALQTVVSIECGPVAGAVVGKVIAEAQSDLLVAGSLIYDFGATPGVGGVLTAVQSNLADLLTAGHVKNASSVATVTKVIGELNTLAAAIPAAVSAPATPAAAIAAPGAVADSPSTGGTVKLA